MIAAALRCRTRGVGRYKLVLSLLLLAFAMPLSACTLGTSPKINLTTPVASFGSNPGELLMFKYVPAKPAPEPAMVVVLHHCFQHANDYIEEAAWRALADRYGWVLLMPEQQGSNDFNRCFGWYSSNNKVALSSTCSRKPSGQRSWEPRKPTRTAEPQRLFRSSVSV